MLLLVLSGTQLLTVMKLQMRLLFCDELAIWHFFTVEDNDREHQPLIKLADISIIGCFEDLLCIYRYADKAVSVPICIFI